MLTQDLRQQRKSQRLSCLSLFSGGVSSVNPHTSQVDSLPTYSRSTSAQHIPNDFLFEISFWVSVHWFFFPPQFHNAIFISLSTYKVFTYEILRLTNIRYYIFNWSYPDSASSSAFNQAAKESTVRFTFHNRYHKHLNHLDCLKISRFVLEKVSGCFYFNPPILTQGLASLLQSEAQGPGPASALPGRAGCPLQST